MILKLIDNKIRQAFSDSAVQYEVLAGLQKEIGRDLVKKVQSLEDCQYVLDVGMGTGRLTNRLKFYFPEAMVIGVDFASGMVDSARKKYDSFTIIQADARQLPFKEETFDLIVSNLAYQWVNDLDGAFKQMHCALTKKGVFCATIFGERTLEELFTSLEQSRNGINQEELSSIRRLPEQKTVKNALSFAEFKDIKISSEIIKVHFEDMMALLKWLKDIGANANKEQIFIGKEHLLRANDYYQTHFKDRWGVYASFEVIWIKAKKTNT